MESRREASAEQIHDHQGSVCDIQRVLLADRWLVLSFALIGHSTYQTCLGTEQPALLSPDYSLVVMWARD